MKKALSAFSRAFFIALSIFMVSGLISCKSDDDSSPVTFEISEVPSALQGTWLSSADDSYDITNDTFVNYMYEGAKESYTLNFVGAAEVEGTEKPTYYLYYKSPETYTYTYGDYSGTYYTKNYYTAVRVIVESDTVLDICCACNKDTYVSEAVDLETVVSDFTIDGGYFERNTEYTKLPD
ncbi:hypothetical protein [Treponema sp.]|uniref:hypothetical protein n=1 Tax=Treponema sp. TaxID=166 RepID=UPI0025DCF111|nr:hypothetical protein [Treponema sp.]MCR5218522.1 hypothetical protein [Treponema sp.]